MPKSVPHLVLDKVRQVLVYEGLNSNVYVQLVPNISHSQELNNDFACVGGRERNILMPSGL